MYDFIIREFYQQMNTVDLNTYGMIDTNNKIHTLGTDSKIIGRIFEMFAQPILENIAQSHGLLLETPESQTVYPDFIMMPNKRSHEKAAIDIKTTYVDSNQSTIKFALGSYGSYMRNNTKNIQYSYTDYVKHYVIGFVYRRNGAAQESQVYDYADREKIIFPYFDVRYFIQEKYKIAGDKTGSGNTENIGSFPTKNITDLRDGKGPFSELGADAYDIYWKYYPKYRSPEKTYLSLEEFLTWLPLQKNNIQLFHPYDHAALLRQIELYRNKHGIK